jgi:transposase InsO family protein
MNIYNTTSTKGGDVDWWKSFYHYDSGSGSDYIYGHITRLFLATHGNSKKSDRHYLNGPSPSDFGTGITQFPFVWKYFSHIINMNVYSGFGDFVRRNDSVSSSLGYVITRSFESPSYS